MPFTLLRDAWSSLGVRTHILCRVIVAASIERDLFLRDR